MRIASLHFLVEHKFIDFLKLAMQFYNDLVSFYLIVANSGRYFLTILQEDVEFHNEEDSCSTVMINVLAFINLTAHRPQRKL